VLLELEIVAGSETAGIFGAIAAITVYFV